MEISVFKEELFRQGLLAGFTEMEIFVTSARDFSVRVFKKEIDNYSLSEVWGLGFRGKYQGRMGYAYTEIPDQQSVTLLIKDAKQNAIIIDSTDDIEIFAGSNTYPKIEAFNPDFSNISVADKIEFALNLEQEAYSLDPRVTTVNYALFADGEGEVHIANTKGLDRSYQRNGGASYVSVVVKDEDEVRTAGRFVVGNKWECFNVAELAKEAVEEAVSMLGAQTIDSKEYPVILRHDVAGGILQTFSSVFSAESVQKGFSLLKDKIGETIAAQTITLIDDPLLPDGAGSAPFDSEGVATKTKEVIKDGVLITYLHNLKTAKKDGIPSTGNASKGSFRSPVRIAPTNFFIQPGDLSYDELMADLDEGLIIISVQGLHSGANPVSGDFSLGAYGYYVKNGKIDHPVDQITIAGNFFQLLKDVTRIGSDLKFGMGGSTASPSILIKGLAVSGK